MSDSASSHQRRAIIIARRPEREEPGSGLGAVKAWPGSVGVRRTVGATASLDRASTRCPGESAGRDGETGFRSNKETEPKEAGGLSLTGPGRPSFRPAPPDHKEADS
jgi:hypothetical protein